MSVDNRLRIGGHQHGAADRHRGEPAAAGIAWNLADGGVSGLRWAVTVSIVVTVLCFAATAIAARGRRSVAVNPE